MTGPCRVAPARPFEVLFVCGANLGPSVVAEVLARQLLGDRLGRAAFACFAVASAGVRAEPGRPVPARTCAALVAYGAGVPVTGPGAFAARRLDEDLLRRSDLVLTAEEAHRAAAVWLCAEALPKVYGMRRFTRMLRALDPDRLPADPVHRGLRIMECAPRLHAALPPVPPGEDAVPDPADGPVRDHLRAADLVFDVVAAFVDAVAPPGRTARAPWFERPGPSLEISASLRGGVDPQDER